MAEDHGTKIPNKDPAYITTGADGVGTLVTPPATARSVLLQSVTAFRLALSGAESLAMTDLNSQLYAADVQHLVWLPGVAPGSFDPTTGPFLIASVGAGTQIVSAEYHS